jgi:hypothetical protein
MAEYVLHCFAQSGNAYKAALMLELAGADWTPHFIDYFGGETRTPAPCPTSSSWPRCWRWWRSSRPSPRR